MPFYEYQCKSCGHQLEAFQKMSDAALQDCPICHKPELVKQVSAPAFHLKGGGWYATDFKDKNKKDEKKDSASGDTKSNKPDKKDSKKPESGTKEKSSSDSKT